MTGSYARISAAATALSAALVLGLVPVVGLAPAGAAARVTISNTAGDAVVDPTYATTLTLRGKGFQSIKNGHGGIYVLFGVVKGKWRPSQGGHSYLTVPDSQTKNNAGYAKFVAFPGSDTAGSANGGTIGADGSWSTKITVPGGTFTTYDTNQQPIKVDCRVSVCGVITIGAHGVVNAHNETFTRVRVGKVATSTGSTGEPTSTGGTTGSTAPTGTTAPPATTGQAPVVAPVVAPVIAAAPALEVDRASAKPGRVLSFSAVGLDPGSQVTAVFENGLAGVGPMTVGASGQLAGVLQLPASVGTGTYELRITGGAKTPAVRFAVVADAVTATDDTSWKPIAFAGFGGGVLLLALVAAVLIRRKKAHRA